ncbi:VOC family protein [Embleya hyalina]|uniref:Glyoxalase n=1 Tax=Embleya hyalina TaxID=516124 RepID=A0A401Z0G3_9ACTN|nr:VOC family protein [Embleya hyalina]GCE00318.1 glyoxalase [Embleya hyalina]
MTIRRTNHMVLSVRDLDLSTRFYRDVVGLEVIGRLPAAAHWPAMTLLRSAPESSTRHDLGLIADTGPGAVVGRRRPGLYHVAFEVDTIAQLHGARGRLLTADALGRSVDQGTRLSVHGHDPDGIMVEILWRVPLGDRPHPDEPRCTSLDFDRARQHRYGRPAGDRVVGAPA